MVADHATRPRAETLPRIRTLTVFRILSDKTIIRRSDGGSSSSNQIPAQLQIYPSCSGSGEKAPEFRYRSPIKRQRTKPNLNGAPLSVYLMTGTLTRLLGNRILLMSLRSKRLIPCSPLTFLSLFIAITMTELH
jgi:hypothetical protein